MKMIRKVMMILTKYGGRILSSKVLLYFIKNYLGRRVIKTMLEGILIKLLPNILNSVMGNKDVQEWFRDLGRELGESIPSDVAEPQIAKALDLVKEGMMETVNK